MSTNTLSIPSPNPTGPAVPSSTSSSGTSGSGNEGSSSLYLFTFLATLSLLLVISCSIIVRTIVIRRRFRRRMEEALAAGALPPAGRSRRGRRFFGDKPKLYDAWAQPGGEKWESIMPIAAKLMVSSLSGANTPRNIDAAHPSTSNSYLPSRNPFSRWARRSAPSSRDRSPSIATHNSRPLPEQQEERAVQVSVLVAMPSCTSSLSAKWVVGEEPGVPDVVVGVAQLPYRTEDPKAVDVITTEGG